MGFFDDIKNKANDLLNKAKNTANSIISGAYNKQKDILASAQKQGEGILNAAYEKQKAILADGQAKVDKIVQEGYDKQKEIIADGQLQAEEFVEKAKQEAKSKYSLAIDGIFDKVIGLLKAGPWYMKIAYVVLYLLRDKIKNGLKGD